MIKLSSLVVIVGVLLTTCAGQWPLGPDFYRNMDQMHQNLNDMTVRLQGMGERIARENAARQTSGNSISVSNGRVYISNGNGGRVLMTGTGGSVTEDDMRRARSGTPFGNGGSVFITASGGLGYAYNSSDGSFTMYSLGSDSPPRGYMYHVGPQRTSFRSW